MTDLVEITRQYLNDEPEDLEEQELLNEIISLRTGVIAGFLAKTKQYANRIDTEVRSTKSDLNAVKREKTAEEKLDKMIDAMEGIANILFLQRKMEMYGALTSASTGVGVDKGTKILQKMQKEKKRR